VFVLDRASRMLLALCAFGAFAGSFVTAPSVAGSAPGVAALPIPLAAPHAVPSTFAVVEPRRDPFAGEPRAGKTAATVSAFPSVAPALPSLTGISAAIQPLPPNAGAAGAGLPFGPQPRVTAVVTGRHPFALVDEAGTTRVVTVGDRIDGDTIAGIDAVGVRLERGAMLPVAPPAPPTALPFLGGRLP
jgi:hypothetical protein